MSGLKTIQDLRHLGFKTNIPKIYMDPSCIYIYGTEIHQVMIKERTASI